MSTKQIMALLQSRLDGDDEQFLSIALQFAAQQARQGNTVDADTLKRLVQATRERLTTGPRQGQAAIPFARPKAELQGLVESGYPKTKLDNMVLAIDLRARLDRIVRQQRDRGILRNHGQVPTTHILLVGPPGTGKTMTAAALAGELNLPLFTVRLEALFSRFFGETAGKLRLLFDQIAQTRAVYLLDEFDAIGARRADVNDIGEVRRVLNSVLAFMEEPNSTDSLVIAATNHSEILDKALARRFDEVIEYSTPDHDGARALVERRLGKFKLGTRSRSSLLPLVEELSQAELVRAADAVVKDAIIAGKSKIAVGDLKTALQDRQKFLQTFRSRQRGK